MLSVYTRFFSGPGISERVRACRKRQRYGARARILNDARTREYNVIEARIENLIEDP